MTRTFGLSSGPEMCYQRRNVIVSALGKMHSTPSLMTDCSQADTSPDTVRLLIPSVAVMLG